MSEETEGSAEKRREDIDWRGGEDGKGKDGRLGDERRKNKSMILKSIGREDVEQRASGSPENKCCTPV